MNSQLPPRLRRADELSRRQFVARTASSLLGVGLLPGIDSSQARAAEAPVQPARAATAKNVIYLYTTGGQSHIDTWDPKEGECAGPTKAIKTSVAGVRVSEYLPLTARQMHHVAVINSLTSTQGAHEQGNYFMHTSYALRGTIRHPGMGAWLNELQPGAGNETLPNYVYVGNDSRHPGAGFLPAVQGPMFVNNPENGVKNIMLQKDLTEERFAKRMAFAADLDRDFRTAFPQRGVKAYADTYDSAISMMKSKDLNAFDLTEETATRDAYGRTPFGQGCLLARRLVQRGVRFVEVSPGGWDTHQLNFVTVPERCQVLDPALAALLGDLHTRGLLKETLVVLATEFGRTPGCKNLGREHYPQAFSGLLAGGGVKAGIAYGKTDQEGGAVVENAVTIPDFNATIAYALGLPLDKEVIASNKRPLPSRTRGGRSRRSLPDPPSPSRLGRHRQAVITKADDPVAGNPPTANSPPSAGSGCADAPERLPIVSPLTATQLNLLVHRFATSHRSATDGRAQGVRTVAQPSRVVLLETHFSQPAGSKKPPTPKLCPAAGVFIGMDSTHAY